MKKLSKDIEMKSKLVIFFSILPLFLFSQVAEVKKVEFPAGYESKIDVVYTQVDGWDGRIDFYYNPKAEKPTPIVLNIHGGGWNHGSKESQTGFQSFFKAGFAVANVAYRLVDVAPAPGAIEDIRSAIEYIKLNAKELNIDPEKVVLMGGSAGAHLALMGGLLENDRRFDTNCKTKTTDMRVSAIINKYAPTDFTDKTDKFYTYGSLIRWMGKNAENENFRASISPISYVKSTSPPIFIVHGTADPIVPYIQSVKLQKKLEDAGVYHEFVTVEGGLHGKFEKEKNSEINRSIISFLKKVNVIK